MVKKKLVPEIQLKEESPKVTPAKKANATTKVKKARPAVGLKKDGRLAKN